MSEQKPQLTAAQRLLALENALATMDQAFYAQAVRVNTMYEAMTLINERLDAIIVALSAGSQVNDQIIDQIVQNKEIEKLEGKLQQLVEDGRIAASEEITERSLFVAREMDSETGKVLNPRIQVAFQSLVETNKPLFLGKKPGESVKLDDEKTGVFEIERVFEILEIKQESEVTEQEETAQSDQQ